VLDDVEQVVIIIEDGSIATVHNNDEFIVINWYSNKIPPFFSDEDIDETIWMYLDSGRRYWKDLNSKYKIDNEVIQEMLNSLYGEVEFERNEEVECFCEKDLKFFLNKTAP
ncbi:MAG: hypothetical protein ACRDE2_16795, partial [Chitinophagaceae bacterium]